MKTNVRVCMTAVAIAILFVSCVPKQQDAPSVASAAPNFKLQASDGSTVELKALQGKAVVLNFWATWCGPCRAEMPGMMQVYDRLKGQGLEIVGISLDNGGWNDVRPFLARLKVTYPIVVGDEEIARAYKIPDAIPFSVFIDRKGNITGTHVGSMPEADFEREVKKLL